MYDLGLGLASDWTLFGGQLLAVPGTPACLDHSGSVLQNWVDDSIGQLVSQSPTSDILQDSLWSDAVEGTESSLLSSSLKKENHRLCDDALLSTSPEEVFVSYDEFDDVGDDLSSAAGDKSWDLFGPSYSGVDSSPIDVKFEYGNIPDNQVLLLSAGSPLQLNPSEPNVSSLYGSTVGYHTAIGSLSYSDNPTLQYTSQEISFSRASEFDGFECCDESLSDAESVCKILERLVEAGNRGLSTVSPEEVESVLSQDMTVSSDAAATSSQDSYQSSAFSSTEIHPNVSLITASIAGEYLQSGLLLKAVSSRASTPSSMFDSDSNPDRRLKKKEQNKTAALRYRRKKREEKGVVVSEVEELEQKNDKLRARADDLSREISYLKGLLEEIQRQ